MKRILITLIVLLTLTGTGYSQLTINVGTNRYTSTLEDAVNTIIKDNSIIDKDNIVSYSYKFDNGMRIWFYIFTDNDGYFLDIIFIKHRKPNTLYETLSARRLYYNKTKIVNINSDFRNYKLLLDDGSFITINFDYTQLTKSEGVCSKNFYKYYQKHSKSEHEFIWIGYQEGYKPYEYVDCK